MIKRILNLVFYSSILFCVVSFLSLIISVIKNKVNHTFPNFELGFPFKYYYQIQVNFELQYGTTKTHLIYNFIICFIVIVLFNYKQQTKNNINE
jgi:hypothetical protein